MPRSLVYFILFLTILIASPGHATVPLDGYFIAGQDCPAYSSIKKKKNPGDIKLVPERAYAVIGKNKSAATHYLLRLKNANPRDRWVAISCGKLLTDCKSSGDRDSGTGSGNGGGQSGGEAKGSEYVLAVSWQPAFCQTHQSKVECETQTDDRYDASHLTLHGLWPQPRNNIYCGVSNVNRRLDGNKAWSQLPPLGLTDATLADLAVTMPGVASFLHRHEWYKHGTCHGGTPEEYYLDSLLLMDQLNDSVVRDLFASNVGQTITAKQIRDSFDQAFGDGSGNKVKIECTNGMITELQISLKGEIETDTKLDGLLAAGATTNTGCRSGRVDAVGF
jgi:ribonuclease T2